MQKHLITASLLLLAFVCYSLGMALPAGIFMLMGMLLEIVFWVRVFRR